MAGVAEKTARELIEKPTRHQMQTRGHRRPTESSDQAGLAAVEGQSRIGQLGKAASRANVMVGERLQGAGARVTSWSR